MHCVDTTVGRGASRILFDPLPGTGYRAVRRLGGGSSSEVFEARSLRGARCAVKVLRAGLGDAPDAIARLEREGRALSALAHPNLARVLDVGTTSSGRPYFVMPLLEGETLRERLRRSGPLAPPLACAIFAEALEGLDAAHRAGIVHRDVKPANVFLERLPGSETAAVRAVVLDFGVAKIAGEGGASTTASHVVGTPRYLAPEQIIGGRVDARTDVYAAGIALFEAIAGRSPFGARGILEAMRAHLDEEAPRLRDLATVSFELDHAVARAVAKRPARRWPSARAFAAVLERARACEAAR